MAFEELKQQQSVMWGTGDYEAIAALISDVHDQLVATLAPKQGERWLDVATGTGGVAERAARAGAVVTGIDLAPALIDVARRRARDEGLEIDYRVGDCERLDVADGSFDVVSSCFGAMFAPDQRATANELARAVRTGGQLALANWTPDGGVGQMFEMTSQFQPMPSPVNPLEWGREDVVRELLGDAFDLEIERHVSTHHAASSEEYWQLFTTSFGPTKALADSLGERREEFHRAWIEFFDDNFSSNGGIVHERDYLLVTGTRR
jgi:ubiquinone/menaquinone biosynthesis C-methylase UbiE